MFIGLPPDHTCRIASPRRIRHPSAREKLADAGIVKDPLGERPIDNSSISIGLGLSSRPRAISSCFCSPSDSVDTCRAATGGGEIVEHADQQPAGDGGLPKQRSGLSAGELKVDV